VLEPTVHPDKHIWSHQDVETNGQVVAAIMTQLSMKGRDQSLGQTCKGCLQGRNPVFFSVQIQDTISAR
jgi:hypothetical protein